MLFLESVYEQSPSQTTMKTTINGLNQIRSSEYIWKTCAIKTLRKMLKLNQKLIKELVFSDLKALQANIGTGLVQFSWVSDDECV